MWDKRPAASMTVRLTRNVHVGKVWRVPSGHAVRAGRVHCGHRSRRHPRPPAPLEAPAVRLHRRATTSLVASTLLLTGLAGCSSGDHAAAAGGTLVIGA